jgi:hypothetical protein
MPDNKKMIVTLLLGILIGVVAISVAGNPFSSSSFNVPSGHTAVASKIAVVDTTMGNTNSYVPTFTWSGKSPSLSIVPLSFTATGSVQVSKWEYRSDVDDGSTVYAYLTIFGPDVSGHTYWVEVSRASPDALTITYPTGTQSFTYNGIDGYKYFEVNL